MPTVTPFPRPVWVSPFYSFSNQYGDTTDPVENAATLVGVVGDPDALGEECARIVPTGRPIIAIKEVPAEYLSQTVAIWVSGASLAALEAEVLLALAITPEKPVIAYLDTGVTNAWPAARPSWVTDRVWPSIQAYRDGGEGISTFASRVTTNLNRVQAYGRPFALTAAFYDRSAVLTEAEVLECMPVYDDWLQDYSIVLFHMFADRRPTGMITYPSFRDWARAFLAATPARPGYNDYWTATSTPPPPPPAGIIDGWYGQWAPGGGYFACGSARVTVATVSIVGGAVVLSDVTDVNQGLAPQWFTSGTCLLDNGVHSLLTVPTPAPFIATALIGKTFNAYGAGGGVYAGFTTAGGVHMEFSDGPNIADRRLPTPAGPSVDQTGRAVYTNGDETVLYLRQPGGGESVLDTAVGIFRPHISLSGAVWQRLEAGQFRTYGWRGTAVERLQVSAQPEFSAIPIESPTGLFVLSHDHTTLYLRPWGQPDYQVVAVGEILHPHGMYTAAGGGGFLISWNDNQGRLSVRFLPTSPTTPPPTDPPPPGPPPTDPPPPPGVPPPGPGSPAGTLTSIPAAKVVPKRRAIYPHVPQITDINAQQSVKLLWDKVQAFEARLEDGDIAERFSALSADVQATRARLDAQRDELAQDPADGLVTTIPEGGGTPGGGGGEEPPPGGGGSSGSCADSPGSGHFDPGGPLDETRARKISCGTGDEFVSLRAPVATLAERENNAEILIRRIIWHLQLGGFTAGRQRNPSTAISRDKMAVVIGTETRAFDVFAAFDSNFQTQTMAMQWNETFPADLVADAGIAD